MQFRIIMASALLAAALAGCGGSGKSSTPTQTQTVASPPSATSTPVTPPTATATPPPPPAPTDVPQITAPAPTANQVAPTQVPPPPPPPPVDTPVPPPPPPPADTHVSLIAEGTRFKPVSLTAPAGGVTIVFDNRDNGTAHNVNVFSGGTSIGSTSPAAGPITETLALGTLAPGSYSFVCDVHPQTMRGVLAVGG